MKATVRAVFYLSLLALFGLAVWAYSTALTWQDIAAAADKTHAKAAKVAKEAVDRADRCASELQKTSQPQKKLEQIPKTASTR